MANALRDPVEEIHIVPEDTIRELRQQTQTRVLHEPHRTNINRDPQNQHTTTPFYGRPVYKCEKCDITVTSRNVLNRHLMGRKHIQKVEREGKTFECDLCSVVANGQTQLEAHLQSARHKARLFKRDHGHEIITKGALVIILSIGLIFIILLAAFKTLL